MNLRRPALEAMDSLTFTSAGPEETSHLARALAVRLRAGDLVLLRGPLGSGKSHFARALVSTLMQDPRLDVPSPTYNLVMEYGPAPNGPKIAHADLYRLSGPHDIEELALEDALERGLLIVEWPEIAEAELKATASRILDIRFCLPDDRESGNRRMLDIHASSRNLLPPKLAGSRSA